MTVDKRDAIQISGDTEDVELKGFEGIELDKELEQGEDVIEKREEKGWIGAKFVQGLKHNTWVVIPSFVQNGLNQNVKMDHKKNVHRSLQTMQLLPMYRCKYTSEADIESSGL